MRMDCSGRSSIEKGAEERPHPNQNLDGLGAIDPAQFSSDASSLLDRYRINNVSDPVAIVMDAINRMNGNQREVIAQFEAAIALAGIEFGRIDLAIQRTEEIERRVELLVTKLDRTEMDFTLTTDKIRRRSNVDILLNHLMPLIYGIFGAVLTLIVLVVLFRIKILH